MIPQIEFRPLGRRVSCLGLGCARLDGRVGLRRSARLLETALDLGINYFDVAESYGTAEEALGHVLGGSRDVVIATKVGPPVRPYNTAKMLLKTIMRPVLDHVRSLKALLNPSATAALQAPNRPRYDFSRERIERSFEASRMRLRRDFIDVFLAHEPHRSDLNPDVESHFRALVERGNVGAYGVGIAAAEDRWSPFGSIWQSGWARERHSDNVHSDGITRVFHGVLRFSSQDGGGELNLSAVERIRAARRAAPESVLLVSASTPDRLRQLVEAVAVS
jgi:hypothetical protein